ncbi:type II secretion system protein [Pectinatus sottacetonis]|uniref:type II secretion system protein n=1 Tax=Pectinatus sottacetonis TaxID=1002795 RepID=UPI0018C5CD9C|nr:hypothetical protein [Pectinatus sottacetonis]
MKKSHSGFINIELITALFILSLLFSIAMPQILVTKKMQIDFQAQYLTSNLRLIQEKSFSLPESPYFRPYIVVNKQSYEIHNQLYLPPTIITMPKDILLSANKGGIIRFNRGSKYTNTASTIKISDKNYTRKVIINAYGRIRIDK